MTKEEKDEFENFTQFQVCNNDYIHNDVKVRDFCHITGKYRGSAYRDCNINVKFNHKIHVIFHNLKKL